MPDFIATIRPSYIDLRGLNLGIEFMRSNELLASQRYLMVVEGLPDVELQGTLNKDGFIGGLSVLYREFDLSAGDKIALSYDGAAIRLAPPPEKRRTRPDSPQVPADASAKEQIPVFERERLRHIHIEPYAPGSLERWVPQTEPDVYMVFGALADYTDYRYCCGTSTDLLRQLGYAPTTKPDAVLIDRSSGQYLMAEFKMNSKDFALNHQPRDVDVLVCWVDDADDRSKLPGTVLGLKDLLKKRLQEGDLDL